MLPFFYLFVPIAMAFLLKSKGFRGIEVFLFYFSVISLFFLLGFRAEEVGIDTSSYYSSFYRIERAHDFLDIRYEPGYLFLNRFIDWLGFGPRAMVVVSSMIIIFSVAYFVFKLSPAVGLSLMLYVGIFGYFFAFNGMRQSIAQSLILAGFAFQAKDKKSLSLILYFLSPLFHYTALIYFPFLLVFYLRKKALELILLLAWVSSLPFVASSAPFRYFSSFIFRFAPAEYSYYVENPSFEGAVGVATLFYQFLFFFLFYSYVKARDSIPQRVMVLSILGIIISNYLTYSGFLSRISFYWEGFLIVSIPVAIFSTFRCWSRLNLYFLFFAVATVFYFRAVFVSSNAVTPYFSWLL